MRSPRPCFLSAIIRPSCPEVSAVYDPSSTVRVFHEIAVFRLIELHSDRGFWRSFWLRRAAHQIPAATISLIYGLVVAAISRPPLRCSLVRPPVRPLSPKVHPPRRPRIELPPAAELLPELSEVREIELGLIRTDGGTQMRASIDQDVYFDYRDKWLAGVEFDPVVVFYDGAEYWLADGFHRCYGAREAKLETIPAVVKEGTLRDAVLYAVGANSTHGLRRSNEDKHRAVATLLNDKEWVRWSDRKIAEVAGVSHVLVLRVRGQLESVTSSPASRAAGQPRKGRDGKVRKNPKAGTRVPRKSSMAESKRSTTKASPQPSAKKPPFNESGYEELLNGLDAWIMRRRDEVGGEEEAKRCIQALNVITDEIEQWREAMPL